MKKFLSLLVIAASCCFCVSCNMKNQGGLSATAQKNLDAMHGVNTCFDSKDFSKVGDYIADDAVDHAGDSGDVKGIANIKAQFEKWGASVESQKTEIIKELADDDYVMAWQRYAGKMKTDGMGYKAGETFEMQAIEVAKFKDGKAVEHWSFMQPSDMMAMMKKMQPMTAPAATADSSQKMK